MGADLQALIVEQIGLRRLEGPFEALALGLADIDLDAVCRDFEQQRGALRGCYPGLVGIDGKGAHADQNSRSDGESHIWRNFPELLHSLNNRPRSNLVWYLAREELAVFEVAGEGVAFDDDLAAQHREGGPGG